MVKMNKNVKSCILILATLVLMMGFILPVQAVPLAPDKAQRVLDLMSVECQSLYDYSSLAATGNYASYNSVKDRFSTAINNVSVLLNGFASDSVQTLWNAWNGFQQDSASAQYAAGICQQVRSDLYARMSQENGVLNPPVGIITYDQCVAAGYYVNGGTCFIGGTMAYDTAGNIIGVYYTDCFDANGYHQGTCWDCMYGANQEGCNPKP